MSDTARTCPACGGRSGDAMLCRTCQRITRRALHKIAQWWPTLEETITRQARLHASGPSGAVFRPVPFETSASHLADQVHADLVGWVRILADELDGPWPEMADTPSLARHLTTHLPTLRRHEDAAELPLLDQWVARIMRAVDYPDERGKIKVGPCPEKIEDEHCEGIVWARFFESETPTMTCEGEQGVCGKVWPAGQWEHASNRILRRMEEQRLARERAAHFAPKVAPVEPKAEMPRASIMPLVTVADAASIYGVPEGTIRRWLSERKLWPFGTRGMRLVSAWQVADLAKRKRFHPTLTGPEGPADPIADRVVSGLL